MQIDEYKELFAAGCGTAITPSTRKPINPRNRYCRGFIYPVIKKRIMIFRAGITPQAVQALRAACRQNFKWGIFAWTHGEFYLKIYVLYLITLALKMEKKVFSPGC